MDKPRQRLLFALCGMIPLGGFFAMGCDSDGALPQSLTPSATAATGDSPPAVLPMPALPPLPPLPGDRLSYRFVDHAGEAQLDLPPPSPSVPGHAAPTFTERLQAFDSPYKLVSPYSGLRGEAALRVIEVAVAEPAVEKYPFIGKPSGPPAAAAGDAARFDPVWNRYRGVYESKVALFAPAPACYRFKLVLPKQGILTLSTAAIPAQHPPTSGGANKSGDANAGAIEFAITVDDKPVWKTQASRKDESLGHWLPAEIRLPPGNGAQRELSFCTSVVGGSSAPAGFAVFGNPELWAENEGAAAPNVLLILVDTLRHDAVPAMSHLLAYAQQGVSFTQAVSAATWTRPALLGLLGGDLPTAVGQSAEEMIPSERDRKRFYALDRRLLPRLLRDAGLKISSVGNNFFLLGYPQIGLSLGFDEVDDVRHPVEDSPAITRSAVSFLRQHQKHAFFLQLHYDAPHWPYTPPPEHLRGIPDELAAKLGGGGHTIDPMARAYLGEAAYADAQIAIVLEELKHLGLNQRTLVIVLGDHGEIFDPAHNHFVQALHQPTLYHHGWSAYDEVLRVPLLLSMPGRLPEGVAVGSQVRLIDVAPTVLDLLGLSAWRSLLPSGARGAGQSLLPLVFSEPSAQLDRPAFAEGQNIRALRSGGYLYLRRGDPRLQRANGNDGVGPIYRISEELYDLRSDPQQHHDLVAGPHDAKWEAQSMPKLVHMRDEFARYAPLSPERGLPVTHLMLATDSRAAHLLTGTLVSSDTAMSVQGVRGGEVLPRAPGRIDVSLRPGGTLDVLVDPTARLELTLSRDGLGLGSRELLLGPFSLPLLASWNANGIELRTDGGTNASTNSAAPSALMVDGALLDRLSGAYPPVPGERGEVLLWRDLAAPGMAATASARPANSASEVATLMRDWGYARSDTAAPVSNRPDGGTGATSASKP